MEDIVRFGTPVHSIAEEGGFEAIAASRERFLAIERCLQIVAEAFTQAVKIDENLTRRITDSSRIAAFRHLLTHHYYKTSPRLIWDIVTINLPMLVEQISRLQQQPSTGGRSVLE
jgi:uncharacterized protein with HEPN domain